MDKAELKTLIPSFAAGDHITIAFVGSKRSDSGTFEVVRTRTGRGKGGSQLMDLRGTDDVTRMLNEHGLFVTGTPENESILHIVTSDGVLHGFENETDIPPVFETNNAGHVQGDTNCTCAACALKRNMGMLVPTFRDAVGAPFLTVRIESTYAPFAGTFKVLNAVQLRGRYGQVVITLEKPMSSETFKIWSFRHSAIITSFETVEDDDFGF